MGLVVGARWGALREGMHFSQSKFTSTKFYIVLFAFCPVFVDETILTMF